MPHKCTNCGNTYEDGTDEILSGCSGCGSRKFEYISEISEPTPSSSEPLDSIERNTETEQQENNNDESLIIAESAPEDESQNKARSEIVSDEDLPSTPSSPSAFSQEEDLEQVKQKLHEQFEGIRILEPGNYQINIKKLYDKQECIISIQEDGRYIINVPGMMESEHN